MTGAEHHGADGFTLVEMAVVLIVMGLIMLTIFPALTALRTGSQRSLTQTNLQALMTATAVYVQANGCLPCPTPAGTTGSGFGRIGGSTATAACISCATPEGIPPFAALGIPAATAHDGGGHWITMRVDPALTVLPTNPANCVAANSCSNFVPPSAACLAVPDVGNGFCTTAQVGFSDKGLCRTGLSTASRITVQTPSGGTQQAAVIFVSHGVNGYGSYFASPAELLSGINGSALPFPSGFASCASGGYALCNSAATNSTIFYNAPAVTGGSTAYDDILAFADRNTLVSMFGSGSCQTVW